MENGFFAGDFGDIIDDGFFAIGEVVNDDDFVVCV